MAPVGVIDPTLVPEGLFDYIDIGCVDSGAAKVTAARKVRGADAPSRARTAVRAGDILFSTVRPYLRAIAQVPSLANPVASTGFCVLRAAPGIDRRFLLHWVRSPAFIEQLLPLQRGSSYPAVRDADVLGLPIPVAPTVEQVRIGEALDSLLASLAEAETEFLAAKRKLALCHQSLLKSAVGGELTAERGCGHSGLPEAGPLLEALARERGARGLSGAPVPPRTEGRWTLPKSWAWVSLDQLLVDLRSGTAETASRVPSGFPVLRSSAVRAGTIAVDEINYLRPEQSRRSENFLCADDLLITRLSCSVEYVGRCAVVRSLPEVPTQYPDRIFRGRPLRAALPLLPWVVYCFQAPQLRRQLESAAKSTAGHQRISMTDLRGLPIPLPPREEIDRILVRLDITGDAARQTGEAVETQLRLITAQRQNILRAAFSGQLVPQDPSDEPAGVVLDRIRAERTRRVSSPPGRRAVRRREPAC